LLEAKAYQQHASAVDADYIKDNFRELSYIYKTLTELREQFPEKDFSPEELSGYFFAKYPDMQTNPLYTGLLEDLQKVQISPDVGWALLAQIKRRKGLLALSEAAYQASQGLAEPDLPALMADVVGPEKSEANADDFITTNLEELVGTTYSQPGIRWPLDCLNKSLGSLRTGDFGFIFARPETGKTTILANVAGHAIGQDIRGPVVWFNNEEQDNKVVLRVIQSYFGITLMELMGNLQHYNRVFNEQAGKKLLFVNSSKVEISKASVERILSQTNPALVIYDQIDKIKGFKADRDDLALGAIYQWARELAKKYAPTIGVCQADGTAEGQKWLSMANVANAKTSKQAEADFILGIGKTHDEASEYVRYFNISKNKLMGDSDSEPRLRHGRFEVLIEPEIARYKDVISYA
jgi:KaiC/GvpD/RAD55 family RecA-like ATPase